MLWFTFVDGARQPWRVFLATPSHPELRRRGPADACVGVTLREQRAIYIDASQPRRDQDETLLHELMHAALTRTPGLGHRTEERVVEALDGPLLAILRRCQWRPPARPPGARALERRARRTPQGTTP
jgi:hypothetical protein